MNALNESLPHSLLVRAVPEQTQVMPQLSSAILNLHRENWPWFGQNGHKHAVDWHVSLKDVDVSHLSEA